MYLPGYLLFAIPPLVLGLGPRQWVRSEPSPKAPRSARPPGSPAQRSPAMLDSGGL